MISSLTIYLTLPENYACELLEILNTFPCVHSSSLNWLPSQTPSLIYKQLTHHSLPDNNL